LVLVTASLPLAWPRGDAWVAPLLTAAVLTVFSTMLWLDWSSSDWSSHRALQWSSLGATVLLSAAVGLLSWESLLARGRRSAEVP
jgi:hypothetical protein